MLVPNLHAVPKRYLIKVRNFLLIDLYLEKYKNATRFEKLKLDQIS